MRYDLCILSCVVTSNHIRLIVVDGGGRDAIPKFIRYSMHMLKISNQINVPAGEIKISMIRARGGQAARM